ncbi:MAG TPA: VanZ family protein [Acidobacteriota bacterium]|nr:VanZ family protein [Acidobacteriota bacterium]
MPRTYRLLAALYAVLVIALSSWPGVRLPNIGTSHLDKILHFGQYAILAFLVARGWGLSSPRRWGLRSTLLVVALLVFAAVDEYHQGWIPGRDPDPQDFLADAIGVALGFGIGLSGMLRRSARHRRDADSP